MKAEHQITPLRRRFNMPHSLLALAIVASSIFIPLAPARAQDLNVLPGANAGSELVQITIPERHHITDFSAPALPGAGTQSDPYVTDNSSFDVDVDLFGTGHLVIRDEDGNILATYDKLTDSTETITFPINLEGGVGDHILTAEFSDLSDNTHIYGTRDIHVRWKPVVGPSPLPDVPSTGYYYFSGFAVAKENFWAISLILTLIALIIILAIRNHKKSNQLVFLPISASTPRSSKSKSTPRKAKTITRKSRPTPRKK